MKRFFANFFLFCAIILALAFVVDLLVSYGLRHTPKNHLETMNRVMNDSLGGDVLVLGNSRGACGYNTYIMDSILGCNCYNLGVSGKTLRISRLRYQAYRRHNPAPRLIILNIDYVELSEGTLGAEKYMFYPYITDTLVRPILKMNYFSWLDRNIPMYRYRGDYKFISLGLLSAFHIYRLPDSGLKGYNPHPNNAWDGTMLQNKIEKDPHNIAIGFDSAVYQLLDTFLTETTAEGVKVAMVKAPLYYLVQEHFVPQHDTLMLAYKYLSEKHNVPILDYQHSFINYDTVYFKDCNHLCQLGAETFTRQLAHDIDSLQLY